MTDDHAKPWETTRRGLLLLVSSPAGAGKTSLSRRLVSDHADLTQTHTALDVGVIARQVASTRVSSALAGLDVLVRRTG